MLSTIFTNLFNCLTLPTSVLDSTFKTVYTYESESNLKNSFYTSKAIEKLKSYTFSSTTISIDISNNINYTSIMFYHYDNMPMYILIGPYNLKPKDSDINRDSRNILCITQESLDNIIKFYLFIIDKHICVHNLYNTNSPCVTRAINYIKENYTNEISIDELCKELNINKCYFCSIFKKETGSTFINYLNSYKIEKSKELLKNSNLSLFDIAISVGFNNQSYYSTVFKKSTSKTPLEFRETFKNK